MSTFMKRNALFGSAAMFSLLAVLHAPTSLAGEGHSEHEQHAAESLRPTPVTSLQINRKARPLAIRWIMAPWIMRV